MKTRQQFSIQAKQLSFDFGPHRHFLEKQAANEASGHVSTFKAREREQFYRSKAWRRVRGIVLARDGARCRECGRTAAETERIDVDHSTPRSVDPSLALMLSNLRVLCQECHEAKTYREGLRVQFGHLVRVA